MAERADEELLRRADVEPAAFAQFYRRHEVAVVAFVGGLVREPELTIDVAAEVFARAYASRGSYRGDLGSARAWLLGIARSEGAVVEAWLSDLPADQRDAIRRRVLADASYAEIATELVCSEAVVRQRVSRGLASLRRNAMEQQS